MARPLVRHAKRDGSGRTWCGRWSGDVLFVRDGSEPTCQGCRAAMVIIDKPEPPPPAEGVSTETRRQWRIWLRSMGEID